MNVFQQEVLDYLRTISCDVEICDDNEVSVLRCAETGISVIAVPLQFFRQGRDVEALAAAFSGLNDRIFLYEDRWLSCGTVVRSMLRVRTGGGMNVFARNCEVRPVSHETAAAFLGRNHVYGPARAAVRLGLFRVRSTGRTEADMDMTPALAAVATFSDGRVMEDGRISYEWVRYASCMGVRVVGGMGRLLDAFVSMKGQDAPFDVMSYCDLEWYDGRSYRRLGFEDSGYRSPVEFVYLPMDGIRVHAHKLSSDRRYRGLDVSEGVTLYNMGSQRFVRHCIGDCQ